MTKKLTMKDVGIGTLIQSGEFLYRVKSDWRKATKYQDVYGKQYVRTTCVKSDGHNNSIEVGEDVAFGSGEIKYHSAITTTDLKIYMSVGSNKAMTISDIQAGEYVRLRHGKHIYRVDTCPDLIGTDRENEMWAYMQHAQSPRHDDFNFCLNDGMIQDLVKLTPEQYFLYEMEA